MFTRLEGTARYTDSEALAFRRGFSWDVVFKCVKKNLSFCLSFNSLYLAAAFREIIFNRPIVLLVTILIIKQPSASLGLMYIV